MKGKHVHVISFAIPYPPNYGGVVDVYYKLMAFHEAGIKVHLHCFEYDRKHSKKLDDLCHEVHYYKRNVSKTNLFRKKPYIVISRTSEDLINRLLKDRHPILFEGLHSCYYLEDRRLKDRRKIVRTHNIEHVYYMHLAKVEKNIFRRYYFFNEANKLKTYQGVLKRADGIAAISLNDKLHYEKRFQNVEVVTAFHPNEMVRVKDGIGKYILYHGNLDVGENNQAALFLVERVFNNLTLKLIIAGNKPSKELAELVRNKKNIELRANVSTRDIHKLVAEAQVNILPTFQATGIKLKLLSALYTGRHCIVNTPMVKDTGLEQLCVVRNSPDEMKKELLQLFDKPVSKEDIAVRKQVLIENGFSNRYNMQQLIRLLFP